MFAFEFCETFRNTFFTERIRAIAFEKMFSKYSMLVQLYCGTIYSHCTKKCGFAFTEEIFNGKLHLCSVISYQIIVT